MAQRRVTAVMRSLGLDITARRWTDGANVGNMGTGESVNAADGRAKIKWDGGNFSPAQRWDQGFDIGSEKIKTPF